MRLLICLILSSQLVHASIINYAINSFKRVFRNDVRSGYKHQGLKFERVVKKENNTCVMELSSLENGEVLGYSIFNTHPNELEYQYCGRFRPGSVENAFSAGFDVPIQEIIKTKEEIYKSFEDASENLSQTELDWSFVLEINIQAAVLWEELVKQSDNNEEKAKQLYYTLLTKKDRRRSEPHKNLREDLIHYKNNVLTMITDMHIIFDFSRTRAFNFHPLFQQALFEIFITTRAQIYDLIFNKDMNSITFQMLKLKYLASLAPNDTSHMQSIERGSSFIYFPQINDTRYELDGIRDFIRVVLNTSYFLKLSIQETCTYGGLWPGVMRALIHNFYYTWESHYVLYDSIDFSEYFVDNTQSICTKPNAESFYYEGYTINKAMYDSVIRLFQGDER